MGFFWENETPNIGLFRCGFECLFSLIYFPQPGKRKATPKEVYGK